MRDWNSRAVESQVYRICNSRLSFTGAVAAVFLLSLFLWSPSAEANGPVLEPLNQREQSRLLGQWDAQRNFALKVRGRKYIGGLSYQVSNHSCEKVWGLMENPIEHYASALPVTKSVELADKRYPNKLLITHGNSFVSGSYTVDFSADHKNYETKFWLDHSRPKDVEDVFGYIKLRGFAGSRCLITVGVAVDPGSSSVASMFTGMIEKYVVKAAGRIVRYARKTIPAEPAKLAVNSAK